MYACKAGGVKSVNKMILYLKSEDLNKALWWASEAGKSEVVDLLLKSPEGLGSGIGARSEALYLASAGSYLEIMRSLLKAGADAKQHFKPRNRYMGWSAALAVSSAQSPSPTPLYALCSRYNKKDEFEHRKKGVLLLLQYGCDINAIDDVGKTALHHVVSRLMRDDSDEESLLALLLYNGADPTIRDNRDNTLLYNLKLGKHLGAVIQILRGYGADLCVRRSLDGKTPIHTMVDHLHRTTL